MYRKLLALLSIGLLLAACGGSASSDERRSLDWFYQQRIEWKPCEGLDNPGIEGVDKLECATLLTPLDYTDPGGQTAKIAMSRLRATGDRVGSLLTNPGGPGGSGLLLPAALAQAPFAARFDVIGFDPRGLGASTPKVTCLDDAEFAAERKDLDVDMTAAGIEQTERENRDYVAKCVERTGTTVLQRVGTLDVVRDMDVMRAVLGDAKLNYFGGSYGSRIGSTFAETFPDRIRAMVLDAPVDPAANMVDPIGAMLGFQKAFDAYAADCASAPDCPVGTDPARATAVFRGLVNPLIERPVPAGSGTLGYIDAMSAVLNSLYAQQAWPAITTGLSELKQGRGDTFLQLADAYAEAVDRGLQQAVLCLEETRIPDRKTAGEIDTRLRREVPILDDGHGTGLGPLDRCAFWPVPPASQPHELKVSGLPPIVVVATTGDPVTPYEGGVKLARALSAALITYVSHQHSVVGQGVACVDDAVTAYLVDLQVPAPELRCTVPQ